MLLLNVSMVYIHPKRHLSVGAVMYQLLFGLPVWFKDVSKFVADKSKCGRTRLQERNKPLSFLKISNDFVGLDEIIKLILKKALCNDILKTVFKMWMNLYKPLNGEIEVEDIDTFQK